MKSKSHHHQQPPTDGRVFDSIGHAGAGLGVPVSLLRQVKKMGAPGFRGHRIHADELLPWLVANKDKFSDDGKPTRESLEIKKLTLQCERIEFENKVARGKYIDLATVQADFTQFNAELLSVLRRRLEAEMPPKFSGDIALQVAQASRAAIDNICQRIARQEKKLEAR